MAGSAGGSRRGPARLRASHAEREGAVAELRERFAVGQLSQDTFMHRMEAALGARHQDEIAELFTDLPAQQRAGLPGWNALAAAGSGLAVRLSSALDLAASAARRLALGAGHRRWQGWGRAAATPPWLMFPEGSADGFVIGRDPGCDLVIPDLTVSRRHAGLVRALGGWLLTDLGSMNGTRLNGWRVREPVPVRPGDQVSFGQAAFIMCSAPAAADSAQSGRRQPTA